MRKIFVKTAAVVSTILFGFMICVTVITAENRTAVNNYFNTQDFKVVVPEGVSTEDTEYFESRFKDLATLIEEGRKTAQKVEAEGAVLLKNEGKALPLKGGSKISLFGISSVDPAYGGRGSAQALAPLPPVTPKEGFENAGLKVNGTLHDFYSAPASAVYKRAGRGSSAKINDAPWADVIAGIGGDGTIAEYGDAAIYIMTRVGGEGSDMSRTGTDGEGGDYLKLSEIEKGVLTGLKNLKAQGKIKKIIVLLNAANQIESGFLFDDAYSIDAALWIGSVGINGFNAVGDIVAGKVTPSGRLSDTFWYDHDDNPTTANVGAFDYEGAANFDLPKSGADIDAKYNSYVVYEEGIYVGYRYAETRYYDVVTKRENAGAFVYSDAISHPFGYGQSYTDFEYSDFVLEENDDGNFTVKVTVKNVGEDFGGKEVVQIYVKKPFGAFDEARGIEKPAVELVGFAKTEFLEPSTGIETLEIKIDKKDLAVYDAESAETYILTGGDYLFTAGKNSHDAVNNILAYEGYSKADGMDGSGNAAMVDKVSLELDEKSYAVSSATKNPISNLFDHADVNKYFSASENSVGYMTRTDWTGSVPTKSATLKMTQKLRDDMVKQDDCSVIPTDSKEYPAYGKKSDINLIDLRADENGDPISYGDERWDELLDKLTWNDTVSLLVSGLQSTRNLISIIKPGTVEQNGPTGLTQPYNKNPLGRAARVNDPDKEKTPPYYPCVGILASSFDMKLAAEYGDMLGEDAIWAGYAGFYGIGLNTHRSAYGGRAYEYYSEDPFLTGNMASAQVAALQSHGCNAYVKHFALNDGEAQRNGISVWANEQTLREIYLKPFETAIVKGGATNAMAAFNRLGAYHCPADRSLLTDFLRGELGMKGFVVSDMYSIGYKAPQMPIFLAAGCDLPDGEIEKGNPYKAFAKDHGETAWQMREAAKRILYATVHSNAMNGFSPEMYIVKVVPGWQVAVIVLDCLFGAMFAASAAMAVLTILKGKRRN